MSSKNNKNWVDYTEIKEKVGIYDVLHYYGLTDEMKEKGDELVGFCPIHDKNQYSKNSLSANLKKNLWHCFACGRGGNIFDFFMALEDIKMEKAARMIAEAFDLYLPKHPVKPHRSP